MRLSVLALVAVATIAVSGCDSTGLGPDTPGCTTGCTPTPTDPHPTDPTPTDPHPTPTDPTLTFAPVDPAATYLRADDGVAGATPLLLSDYGLAPGNVACFRAAGDFFYAPGLLASSADATLVTGVFSGSDNLSATSELNRVKDAIDGMWHIDTPVVFSTGAATEIDQDFRATDDCWTVPDGATHVFFSAFDDAFLDNTDATAGGQEFGVFVSKQ